MGPTLVVNLAKIKHNTEIINQMINACGGIMFAVTKVVGGDLQVAEAMLQGGVKGLADSRLANVEKMRQGGITAPILLLRSPALSEVEATVNLADISINSEAVVLNALNEAAQASGKIHRVLLMVDWGDGREGVTKDKLSQLVNFTLGLPYLEIYGIGTNLGCFAKKWPTVKNMTELVAFYRQIPQIESTFLSGCNSSGLHLIVEGLWSQTLRASNHWRVGESIFFGRDITTGLALPDCDQDSCHLEAEVIEVQEKGSQKRIIVAVGTGELGAGKVYPCDDQLTIIGMSSDHLVAVSSLEHKIRVGSYVSLTLDYQGLLAAANSEYVQVRYEH